MASILARRASHSLFACVLPIGIAALGALGCSGDDSAAQPGDGGTDVTASDGGANDAATDGIAGSGFGTGSIFVYSTDLGYQLGAAFFVGDPFACMSTTDGACIITPPCNPQGTLMRVGAGTVTFSGGKLAAPATMMPTEDDNYVNVSNTPAAFAGGDTFEVSAVGDRGGVATFDETLVAPDFPVLTSPMIAGDGGTSLDRITIDRSQPFTVTWMPSQHADVEVYFISTNGTNVACVYPAAAGTATIPSSALMHLNVGVNGVFGVQGHSGKTFDAGGYKVRWVVTAGDSDMSPKHLRADANFK